MGNDAAKGWGFEEAPDTLEKSVSGLMKLVSKGEGETGITG